MNKQPKSWSQLRAAGVIIRTYKASENKEKAIELLKEKLETQNEANKAMFNEVQLYLEKYFFPTKNEPDLKANIESSAKKLGPNGHIALCDLNNRGMLKTPAALLVLELHMTLLTQSNDQFKLTLCDEDNGNKVDASWPEFLPSSFESIYLKADSSFCYKVEYLEDNVVKKAGNLTLKTIKMGAKLIVNALLGDEKHFSLELKTIDYVSTATDFKERYEQCILSLSKDNPGLSQFVSRAALTMLSNLVNETILDPIFNVICPIERRANRNQREEERVHNQQRVYQPPPVFGETRPQNGFGMPRMPMINPAGYGDSDLAPNFGPVAPIGGNLLGPGHPSFGFGGNNPTRGGPRPGNVPPGARYDPTGPAGGFGFGGGRRNPRNGGNRGGDHLPPPPFGGF